MSEATKIKRLLLIFLFPLVLGIPITSTAQEEESNPINEASTDTTAYTHEQALEISQAAIGKTIGYYQFKTIEGNDIGIKSFSGKPMVISLVYTSCYHICPMITRHLKTVVTKARDVLGTDSFNVLTIGFDSHRDTPDAMAHFAKTQGAAADNWHFLSADPATIQALTRDLGFLYQPSPQGFDHLIQASIVDQTGKVYRQVYGMQPKTQQFVEPLKELVFGHPVEEGFLSQIANKIKLFCTVYDPTLDRYSFDYSIFIGLFMGLTVGTFFVVIFIREWRHTSKNLNQKS